MLPHLRIKHTEARTYLALLKVWRGKPGARYTPVERARIVRLAARLRDLKHIPGRG